MNIEDILLYLKNIEMKLENKIKDILTIISIKLQDCKDNELLSKIKKGNKFWISNRKIKHNRKEICENKW